MNIITTIEYYCNLKNITFYRLLKDANLPHSTLSDLKSGRCKDIKLSTASKIAKALDITIDELYYGNNIDVNSPVGEIEKD